MIRPSLSTPHKNHFVLCDDPLPHTFVELNLTTQQLFHFKYKLPWKQPLAIEHSGTARQLIKYLSIQRFVTDFGFAS